MTQNIPIIILNWNGIEDTVECLDSLMEQSFSSFIVHLLDNGSDERNVHILKEKYLKCEKVKLHLNPENLGFSKGNNFILEKILSEKTQPPYVVLLNNDTAVDKNWLSEMIKSAERNSADIITSKMVNYFDQRVMDNAGHKMLNTAEVIPIGSGEPIEGFEKPFENMGSCAGATLYSVKMLKDIGLFDGYFETGYEDAELGVRAVVLGYKSIFEPTAIIYHKVSQSIKKVRDYNYLVKIQLNIFYTYFKLMPLPVLLVNLPSQIFKYGILLVIDVVFFRWTFLKMMCRAIKLTATKERQVILKSRSAFFEKHAPIPSWQILKKQTFFLWFDIKRFWKYMILRKPTHFEQ